MATISIRSEPLTPISEPEIESQVLQQLSNGTIRFDVDAGRLISKELQWDESVVGFSGSGSLMEYSARYSEIFKKVEIDQALTKAPPVTAAPPLPQIPPNLRRRHRHQPTKPVISRLLQLERRMRPSEARPHLPRTNDNRTQAHAEAGIQNPQSTLRLRLSDTCFVDFVLNHC